MGVKYFWVFRIVASRIVGTQSVWIYEIVGTQNCGYLKSGFSKILLCGYKVIKFVCTQSCRYSKFEGTCTQNF